jgi:hypothetical protein
MLPCECFDMSVLCGAVPSLQVGTDRQEDAVFRLCVRNLRLFGRAEVDLMKQGEPQVSRWGQLVLL